MFTGIISKTAKVKTTKSAKSGLSLEIYNPFLKVKIGDSISANGVCSTVKKLVRSKGGSGKSISFEYMPETLQLTNLSLLQKNDTVNLEQSLRVSDRLDGHIVLGHVDCTGRIVSIKKEGNSKVFEINPTSPRLRGTRHLVLKGSIAVEGISLTITKVLRNSFIVKLIPYTQKNTNFKSKKVGDIVNLEFDILAKYAHLYANKK